MKQWVSMGRSEHPHAEASRAAYDRAKEHDRARAAQAQRAAAAARSSMQDAGREYARAQRAQYRLDDHRGSEEQQIEVEHAVMNALRAYQRAQALSRHAAVAARRGARGVRQAEAYAVAAARAARETKAAASAASAAAR